MSDASGSESLRDRLIDHIATLHVPHVKVIDGVAEISAESMADALLPFIEKEVEEAREFYY